MIGVRRATQPIHLPVPALSVPSAISLGWASVCVLALIFALGIGWLSVRRHEALLAVPPYWGEGAIGLVAAGGPPHLIRDLQTDITGSLHSVDMHGLQSWLCLPLRDEEQTYGVLTLGRTAARADSWDAAARSAQG